MFTFILVRLFNLHIITIILLIYLFNKEDGLKVEKFEVKAGVTESVIDIPEKLLVAEKKYMLKWYTDDGWLARMNAQTESLFLVSSGTRPKGKNAGFVAMTQEDKAKALMAITKAGYVVDQFKSTKRRAQEMPPSNPSERKVFSEYFSLIDVNNDGSITFGELKNFMLSNGFDVTDGDVMLMMSEADTDHNGTIDFDEFCSICKRGEDLKSTSAWQGAQAKMGEEINCVLRTNKGKRRRG